MAACVGVDQQGFLHLDNLTDLSQCQYLLLTHGEYSFLVPDPSLFAKYFAWGWGAVMLSGVIGILIGFTVSVVRAGRFV